MKHAVSLDDKYTQDSGRIFLSSLQALVRLPMLQRQRDVAAGLNTAGFISGYRGSPLGTYDSALWAAQKHLDDNKIRFMPGINEELAAAAIKGTQWVNYYPEAKYDGVFALWYGKHLGVERACEAIKQGNYDGAAKNGGVLVVCGDDHGGKSSITAAESDHVYIASMVPLLYPADTQEIIDYGLYGWAMSRFAGLWTGLKTVTDTVEAAGTIEIDMSRPKIILPDVERPPEGLNCFKGDYFPLPQERRLLTYKLPAAKAFARANGLDRVVFDSPRRELGIVCMGKVYLDVREALRELGLTEERCKDLGIRVYKVGLVWPLEDQGAKDFCRGHREVLVVDEKRPVVEEQLASMLYGMDGKDRPRLVGKVDENGKELIPAHGERSVNELVSIFSRRIRGLGIADGALEERMANLDARRTQVIPIPPPKTIRTPYFCSGCPHNSSTKTLDQSMTFTGVGCYGMIPMVMPQRNTQWAAQMGAEGSLWLGMNAFVDVPHAFQNLGDGTYFHSGILAVRAAVAAKANVTYKLLYNDAVAMTGGQPLEGEMTPWIMANQLYWEGVKPVIVVTDEPEKYPSNVTWPPGTEIRHRSRFEETQRELQGTPGVTAIIFDQTCAAEKRRRRKKGEFPDPPKRVFINQDVCEGCGDCTVKSNCMSVQPIETEMGRKRRIDQSSCNKDYSCVEGFCPSFVTVHGGGVRKAKIKADADASLFANLPAPTIAKSETPYNILLTGIGGSGVLTVGAILGMAAHVEGLSSSVMDVTGMAQKGGSVLSNIRIAPSGTGLYTPRLWVDSTDLLLGCDLVVSAGPMALQTLRVGSGHVVVNNDLVPTAQFQTNMKIDFGQGTLMDTLLAKAGHEHLHAINGTDLTTRLLGDSIGTNIFMLGYALQKGLLPVSLASVEEAIRLNGVAIKQNLLTLSFGRLAAHDPAQVAKMALEARGDGAVVEMPISQSIDELIAKREKLLTDWQDADYAKEYRSVVDGVRAKAEAKAPGSAFPMTVARVLARVMAYKDEYEVARLYTGGDFKRRLEREFEGDYKLKMHLAPPTFSKRNAKGELIKSAFNGALMLFMFGWLTRFKWLRKTPLNIFGWSAERKMERQLIPDYRALVERVLDRLSPENAAAATEIVRQYEEIKGYGHVKERNHKLVLDTLGKLLDAYEGHVAPAAAQPALFKKAS